MIIVVIVVTGKNKVKFYFAPKKTLIKIVTKTPYCCIIYWSSIFISVGGGSQGRHIGKQLRGRMTEERRI